MTQNELELKWQSLCKETERCQAILFWWTFLALVFVLGASSPVGRITSRLFNSRVVEWSLFPTNFSYWDGKCVSFDCCRSRLGFHANHDICWLTECNVEIKIRIKRKRQHFDYPFSFDQRGALDAVFFFVLIPERKLRHFSWQKVWFSEANLCIIRSEILFLSFWNKIQEIETKSFV